MQYAVKSDTSALPFFLTSSADHITGLTGASPTVTISKNGGTFAAPAGAVAEIGNGWYKLTPTTADVNTNGGLLLHATAAGADPSDVSYQVGTLNVYDGVRAGLTALPNAAAATVGGLPIGDGSGNVTLASTYQTTLVSAIAGSILATTANKLVTDSSGRVTVGTNADKTGYSLTQAFPANFAILSIANSTGYVTSTNGGGGGGGGISLDDTLSGHTTTGTVGWALNNMNVAANTLAPLSALPAHFSLMAIDTNGLVALTAGAVTGLVTATTAAILANPSNKLATDSSGRITVGTNADKTGYSLAQAFPTNFSALVINSSGQVSALAVNTLTLDTSLSGHTTAGTVGGALANLDTNVASRVATSALPANFSTLSISSGGLLALTTAEHVAIGAASATSILVNPGNKLATDSNGYVTITASQQSALAAAVWDVLTSAHTATGSFGLLVGGLGSIATPLTLQQIVNGVWDELTAGHTTANSFAALLRSTGTNAAAAASFGAAPTVDAVATAVAAAILATPGHLIATDSTGAVNVANFAAGLLDLAAGVETDLTVRQTLRGLASILFGVLSGAGTNTLNFAAGSDPTTPRITSTVDSSGNRTAITLHLG